MSISSPSISQNVKVIYEKFVNVASILGVYFYQIFLVPLWLQFIVSFFIGLLVGVKIHNSINDSKVFQRIAGFIVGRFFTHQYDFEPILVFLEGSEITKIAISGRGDLDSEPHRNDIFVKQNYHNEGESVFSLQEPLYVKGKRVPETPPQRVIFKEFEDTELEYGHDDIIIITTSKVCDSNMLSCIYW